MPGLRRQRCLSDTHSNSLTFDASENACPENVTFGTMEIGERCLVPIPQTGWALVSSLATESVSVDLGAFYLRDQSLGWGGLPRVFPQMVCVYPTFIPSYLYVCVPLV